MRALHIKLIFFTLTILNLFTKVKLKLFEHLHEMNIEKPPHPKVRRRQFLDSSTTK
jgi:hypothetical protein